MISTRQIRAARALLDWSQGELAKKSGVSLQSISNVEKGRTDARGATSSALQSAFESYGVEFLPNDGVRMKDDSITVLEGEDTDAMLLDDIFQTLRDRPGEEVLVGGLREADPGEPEKRAIIEKHIDRLRAAGLTERLLIEEGDTNFVAPQEWYRWVPKEYFSPTRFTLYANKLAMLYWGPPAKIIIISNPIIADSYRALFNFAWAHCTIPHLSDAKKKKT
jgi:transcriptional regulator with XRE-family HTH domain